MRLLNVLAALSGFLALAMLVYAAHGLRVAPDADLAHAVERIRMGAYIQIAAAAAGLAVANRTGRLNLIAGAMILAGAALFAGTMYGLALVVDYPLTMLAPVGGITLLVGWLALAFAKPRE
jgi:uncharacterized membrane protein YgdD (TMEM256/DUF423 family)